MNYHHPELISRLSGAYVVGSLRGLARDRFENLMLQSEPLRVAVREWENYFSDLDNVIEPIPVKRRVWRRIEARLFADSKQRISGVTNTDESAVSRWWRSLGLVAMAASLALSVYIAVPFLKPVSEQPLAAFVSVIQDDKQQAVWSVQVDQERHVLTVTAQTVPVIADDQDYELWLLAGDGTPVSLGLLPQAGTERIPLSEQAWENAKGVAVSLEPKGGSPEVVPTGPVLFVSGLHKLG